jgi:hypothetical protein
MNENNLFSHTFFSKDEKIKMEETMNKKKEKIEQITKNEKERLGLSNQKIISVGFIGMNENSIDIINEEFNQEIFKRKKVNFI